MNLFYHFTKNKKKLYILALEDETVIGFIFFNKIHQEINNVDIWDAPTEASTQRGLGWKLHEVGFSLIFPDWFIPFRENNFRPNVPLIYKKFMERDDIFSLKLAEDNADYIKVSDENDEWFNRIYSLIEPKTYDNLEEDKRGWIKHEGMKFFNTLYDMKIKNEPI
jgi:hypothetical protein